MSAYVQTVVGSDSPPVGAVMDFAGNVEPSGWLFCFGQSLPRTGIYAQLFDVIGTLYGSVDGSSFSLPDFRGRVVAGKDNMGGTAANRLTSAWGVDGVTLGANGGTQSHQLTIAQMPSHTHVYDYAIGTAVSGVQAGPNYNAGTRVSQATGGDGAHPNVQPTFVVNKIIKYTVSGAVLPIVPGEGDVVGPDGGVADGDLVVFGGTSGKMIRRGTLLPRGHLKGMSIANNATDAANDIDISGGECRDSTNSVDIKLLAGITKQLDAVWAIGNNAGGLDTGTVANIPYHLFVIRRADTGIVDALFSASATAPTLPANYTHFRRIASIRRLASANVAFGQYGDYFHLAAAAIDMNTAVAQSKFLLALSVPSGIIVRPMVVYHVIIATASQDAYIVINNASGAVQNTVVIICRARVLVGDVSYGYCDSIFTNTSNQIYLTLTISGGGSIIEGQAITSGWIDRRGQDD